MLKGATYVSSFSHHFFFDNSVTDCRSVRILYGIFSCLRLIAHQGVTKRYRLSWLTNSALVYEPKGGGEGGAESQPMSTAVHMEPK
jgi:hypothetical protein